MSEEPDPSQPGPAGSGPPAPWWSKPGDDPWAAPRPGERPGERPDQRPAEPPTAAYPWGPGAPPAVPPAVPPGDTVGRPARERRRGGGLLATAVALALLTGGAAGGVAGWYAGDRTHASAASSAAGTGASLGAEPQGNVNRAPDSVAGIASRVLPSVVSITVEGRNESGTGSGFVLRDDGYILTNNHVVAVAVGGGSIVVHFNDGTSTRATIKGRDESYDLAVIKVAKVSGLKPVRLGNSDSVVVGDPVVAIGSPLGLSGTVTSGIISARNRPVATQQGAANNSSYINALQTDAAINPGNSGGPLVDAAGRVVGVNSAIATLGASSPPGGGASQSGNIGVGFAIPIDQARRVAEQLIARGHASHPIIGASLDPTFTGTGVRIAPRVANGDPPIVPGGPADRAGIRPGDVITKFEGTPVTTPEELIVDIRSKTPGDKVTMTYERGGQEHTVTLTLAAAG